MGTTPNYSWPFPDPGTDVSVPRDIQALADAIDASVKAIETPVVARFSKTASQSVNNATYTPITFPIKDEDPSTMSDAGGTQFTIKKAGIWLVTASLAWAPNATGFRIFNLGVNGNLITGTGAASGGAYNMALNLAMTVRLAVNDIVAFTGYQSSGAALGTSATSPGVLAFLWQRP